MNRWILNLIFLSFIFTLSNCENESLFNKDETSIIKQQIYVVPDRFTSEPYTIGYQSSPIYLEVNQVVKFWATYILNNQYINTHDYDNYITRKNWNVDGEYFNLNSFRYSFSKPGHKIVTLQSFDLLNDSIIDTLDIYVNTPISIKIISPKNGYNLIDPLSEEGVTLKWKISGTDEWENSTCTLYASYEKEYLWKSPLVRGNCDEYINILGPIANRIKKDSSVTIYWGLKATNYAKNQFSETDSTPIYHFSTKYIKSDSADIIIPFNYKNLWINDSINAIISIINSFGDTLKTYNHNSIDSDIHIKIQPQSKLKIHIKETLKNEYIANPIEIDIPASSYYILDTLYFTDNTPPFIEPSQKQFKDDEFISFNLYDNGSGINQNRIFVINNQDTLSSFYENDKVYFSSPKFNDFYSIKVYAQDNARNESTSIFWNLNKIGKNIIITGPFSIEGGNYHD